MISHQDLLTLEQAGIELEALASAAASYIRSHPATIPITNAFSEQEEGFLRNGGAVGLGSDEHTAVTENVAIIAQEFAQMLATSYTQKEVAKLLRVSTSRVRQRIDHGTLYAINGPAGRVCPRFQFADNSTIPRLEDVLSVINSKAHPVAVYRFFVTASPDLESDILNKALSPRDWLLTGHSPDPVILLAKEL